MVYPGGQESRLKHARSAEPPSVVHGTIYLFSLFRQNSGVFEKGRCQRREGKTRTSKSSNAMLPTRFQPEKGGGGGQLGSESLNYRHRTAGRLAQAGRFFSSGGV